MKNKRKRLEHKLDELWRKYRKEDAYCEVCATLPVGERINYTKLDPHHLVSRSNHLLRWDIRNRCWLCSYHHTMGRKTAQHNEFGWFWQDGDCWMSRYRPDDKKYLDEKKFKTKKWSISELEQLIKDFPSINI